MCVECFARPDVPYFEGLSSTNIGTSILFVWKCIEVAYSSNKHFNTYNEILKLSSFLCILDESRLRSKENQNTLKCKQEIQRDGGRWPVLLNFSKNKKCNAIRFCKTCIWVRVCACEWERERERERERVVVALWDTSYVVMSEILNKVLARA